MVQKTTENWELLFLKFDARVAGLAAAVTTTSLILAVSTPLQLIAAGSFLVFGTMAAVDANRLRRLRRDIARKQAANNDTRKEEANLIKRP